MRNISVLSNDHCTGCGACINICPTGAIKMIADSEGFNMPYINNDLCVDCGACVNNCPVLNIKKKNLIMPDMYAVRAEDKVREKSSSGGVFTVLAEEILKNGGFVCGAAFDDNMKLRHIMINDVADLYKLQGSKYLQSDTGLIYKQVKEKLYAGNKVLFVGTPCQVAAINQFVGKKAENLVTVDILCHGVPSQKIFDLYLNGIRTDKKITSIDFRNKRFGWQLDSILIKYFDESETVSSLKNDDVYLRGFLRNLFLRKSCEECPFSEFPRHGDISIGDFWGIGNYDKEQNDGKGTSIVFVNNKKGQNIMENVLKQQTKVKHFVFSDKMPNRIHSLYKHNAQRDRFFTLLNHHSFREAVEYVFKNRYDIGLVSNYCAGNFGGSLTQYALYNVLQDMGYSVLMIDRPADAKDKIHPEYKTRYYQKWPYHDYATSKQYPNKESMRDLNNICDNFVVGSDQLFQNTLYNILGEIYTLDWVANDKRKIAYAASFGYDHVWGDSKQIAEMGYFMQQFDGFSVREDSGVTVAKNVFGVDAVHVLDPVFLCDKKHYDELIVNAQAKSTKNYIGAYILDPNSEKNLILSYVQKTLNKKVEVFSELNNLNKDLFANFNYVDLKNEERLLNIKNSDFFLCDSFHGTCLAIIYNVPFISIVNKNRGGARFSSLLNYFGLSDRMIESYDELLKRPELLEPIDFTEVNKKLEEGRKFGIEWLQNKLSTPTRHGASIYDILVNRLADQKKEIDKLQQMVRILYGQRTKLPFIDSIEEYVKELSKAKEKNIILLSVKDTPGISMTDEFANNLKNALGIQSLLSNHHWYSYVGIIADRKVLFESLDKNKIIKSMDIEGFNIRITSAALKVGNVSEIKVNNKEYSQNKRGINIVVIDKELGTVIDSVCIDPHLKNYVFIRDKI